MILEQEAYFARIHTPDGSVLWLSEPCISLDKAKEALSSGSSAFDLGPYDWSIILLAMKEDAPGGTGRPQW